MADPECQFCDKPAEHECPTCHNLYCSEHGDDVCLRCLAPEAAVPGVLLYRGSLVVLGVASFLAIFLFLRPPEDDAPPASNPEPTATSVIVATATPTEPGDAPSPTPASTETPDTPTPQAESPTPEVNTYTVQPGDSLSFIAEQNGTTVDDIMAANPEIADPADIDIGQVIILP